MADTSHVIEYKCPNCGGSISFSGADQKLTCSHCDSSFSLEDITAYNDSVLHGGEEVFLWDSIETAELSPEDQAACQVFACPACGGELMTDSLTTATFCPFCDNPAVLPQRLSGGLRPEAVLPFRKTKEEARQAFLALCKGKPLLPKFFTEEQRLERITGIYVPFWLYDCTGTEHARYKATRIHTWSDSKRNYTRTDEYLLVRGGKAQFVGIPMDGSSKMPDALMESIEPFQYNELVDFHTAYLSGFFADRYDVAAEAGENRIRQRVSSTMDDVLYQSCMGYNTVIPMNRQVCVEHSRARYVLLPVWMLTTRYKDKLYTFAMNGQTGKMTGTFPVSRQRCAAWFGGICAAVTALVSLIQYLL